MGTQLGTYLASPVTEKISEDESKDHVDFGVSGMQGWREDMEDAHLCLPDVDGKGNCLFGVFDGHGGKEVAEYCALNFDKFLLDTEAFAEGKIEKAFKDAFMTIDEAITSDEVIEILKDLSGVKNDAANAAKEAAMLLEEAHMPLGELLERLKDNVKGKLVESGLLHEDEEEEEEEEEAECEENCNGDTNPVLNGHADQSEKRTRKQLKPVKRVEQEQKPTSMEPSDGSTLGSGSSGAGGSTSLTSSDCGSSGSASSAYETSSGIGGSGLRGSSKYALNDKGDDEEAFAKGKADDDEDDEDEDEEEESDEEQSDDEDDSEDEDEDGEFEDAEGFEFQQGLSEVGKGSGTTAIIALIHNSVLYVANVGDSRCVLCRNGDTVEMSQDHNPQSEIEKNRIETAGGKITSDGRVNGGLNLTRSIGDHAYKVNKELPPEAQMISAMPDVKEIQLTKDDSFMVLACDGIWNVMTNEEVIDFVKEKLAADQEVKLSKICEDLFDRCIAPDTNNDGAGCDNMTCLIVRFKHDENGDIKANGQKRSRGLENDDDESSKKSKKSKLS